MKKYNLNWLFYTTMIVMFVSIAISDIAFLISLPFVLIAIFIDIYNDKRNEEIDKRNENRKNTLEDIRDRQN